MLPDPDLERIKNQWHENNRYFMLEEERYRIFEKAQKDIFYLLNRLHAAEKTARNLALATKKFGLRVD